MAPVPARRARLVAAAAVLWALLLASGPARAQEGGEIVGRVFTAPHEDSVATGGVVTLVFRGPAGTLERIGGESAEDGSFRFGGLSVDPEIQYVVRVEYAGDEYLGSPVAFSPGQDRLEFNVLVSPSSGFAAEDGDLPEGHPPLPPPQPATGRPVPFRADLTLAVTAAVAGLFWLLLRFIARGDRRRRRERAFGPVRLLVREAAVLDARYEAGDLPEEEYRTRRADLLDRIREKLAAEGGAAPAARPVPVPDTPATRPEDDLGRSPEETTATRARGRAEDLRAAAGRPEHGR